MYDPDPIASLRKRRVSTDSHDSGASHPGDLRAGHESLKKPTATSSLAQTQTSKLAESSLPTEKKRSKSGGSGGERAKKKHKKHKHSHRHRHRRHRSGEVSSARTKYAVRSPVRAVEDLRPGAEMEEVGDSSESEREEHRDSESEEEVSFDMILESIFHQLQSEIVHLYMQCIAIIVTYQANIFPFHLIRACSSQNAHRIQSSCFISAIQAGCSLSLIFSR